MARHNTPTTVVLLSGSQALKTSHKLFLRWSETEESSTPGQDVLVVPGVSTASRTQRLAVRNRPLRFGTSPSTASEEPGDVRLLLLLLQLFYASWQISNQSALDQPRVGNLKRSLHASFPRPALATST